MKITQSSSFANLQRLLTAILTSLAGRVLLVSLAVYGIVFEYCRLSYWRDPHSAFFDDRHVYDLKYSLYREHEALQHISAYNARTQPPASTYASPNPRMCLAFVTVKRDHVNYFDASVGSLLSGLNDRERRVFSVNVLFANTNPDVHPSWGQLWMDRLLDSVSSYNVPETDFQSLQALEESHNWHEKGIYDYTYALDQCYLTGAPYIGIFEDDIIFADGWLVKTLRALHDIENKLKAQNWLYLRLFYTETALSWTSDDFAYRHMGPVFLVTMLSACGALLLIRRTLPSARRHLDVATIAVICTITVPAFIGLVFMIGKYNITPLRGVVEMNKHGCCTQAMIFPRDQAPNLASFLRDRKGGQTDSLIEEYADKEALRRFALAPPQVQHVGIRSSRDNLEINTRSTWAFWFEENDPVALRREHDEYFMEMGDMSFA
ncbi:hypothetical protein TMatcc_001419 [Talaromyces marneffei ATCC 18224]|uniref:Integral membrane protein n=1 Tax=Talaromyces marneffei (strain ATCC 18224 / CBS 334.59 / QM 7333) TaxID=441960 RepID=B6QK40_TALMQ|nr:uncharacterized protein EYB26_007348 [Talaromyces marneffei]EEA22572.1 conserved hypothetical protein [Talaromyces marneffei ATCC 18224]KAE8551468.1 hypothetical protein EYB25_005358 [Talaromyces marneffei]QGA19659.1 hypothetical protein EYB26_007348 [Talaromyces marneffei]